MKFEKSLIFLCLAMAVFANESEKSENLDEEIESEWVPREHEGMKIINECEDGLRKYLDCMYDERDLESYGIEKFCEPYRRGDCKEFYEDIFSAIPICQKVPPGFWEHYQSLINTSGVSMNFFCQNDENDELCPMVKYDLSKEKDDEKLKEAARETCRTSPKCKESAHKLYKYISGLVDEEEASLEGDENALKEGKVIKEVFSILDSEDCTVQKKETKESDEKNENENEKVKENIKEEL